MEELKQLRAKLMSVQQKPVGNKLSERNVVEILQKLVEKYDLHVIFAMNGKDYITPARLTQEIVKEVQMEGRVSLLELPSIIGVSIENIENRVSQALSDSIMLVNGQLLSSFYIDTLCSEINLSLQESGQLSLADLTLKHSLPMQFLKTEIEKRFNKSVFGHFSGSNHIVTESYITRHLAKLRGYLRSARKPVDLKSFDPSLVISQVKSLIDSGQVQGKLESSTFTPSSYQNTIWEEIKSQFFINKYIDFDYLRKKSSFLHLDYKEICKKIENGEFFHSSYVHLELIQETSSKISALMQNKPFTDFFDNDFPQCFDEEDIEALCPKGIFTFSHYLFTEKAVEQAVSSLNNLISSMVEEVKESKSKKTKETLGLDTIKNELIKKKFLNAPKDFLEGFSQAVYSKVSETIQERREARGKPAEAKSETLASDFSYLYLCNKSIQSISKTYSNTKPLQIHLCKTLASNFLNDLLKVQLNNQGFQTQTIKLNERPKLIQKLPEYLRDIFNKLVEKVAGKDLDGFVQEVLGNIKDIPVVSVKAVDKKTERVLLRNLRTEVKGKAIKAFESRNWLELAVVAARVKLVDNSLVIDLPGEKWALGMISEIYLGLSTDDPVCGFLKAAGNLEDESLLGLAEVLVDYLSS